MGRCACSLGRLLLVSFSEVFPLSNVPKFELFEVYLEAFYKWDCFFDAPKPTKPFVDNLLVVSLIFIPLVLDSTSIFTTIGREGGLNRGVSLLYNPLFESRLKSLNVSRGKKNPSRYLLGVKPFNAKASTVYFAGYKRQGLLGGVKAFEVLLCGVKTSRFTFWL